MATPSLLIIPDRYKAAKLYSQLPDSGAGDFTVTRGTTATRVNASGLIESVASGVPRLDYTGGGCPSLLVEPAATNSIRNNTGVGAVTGTPGTMPTNYTTIDRGLTREVVGTGVENGIEYFDLKFSGTANATAEVRIDLETSSQIVASNGQQWSFGTYFKIIAAPLPFNSSQLGIVERTAVGTFVADGTQSFVSTSQLNRYSFARTLAGGVTVARVQPNIGLLVTNGASYDFTIRIGLPQMELGAVATSVIKTSTTAITRNADVISLSSVSGLIGATQGTIYAEVNIANFITGSRIAAIGDGTTANRLVLLLNTTNRIRALVSTSNVVQADINTATGLVSGFYKIALAYAENNIALFVNGQLIGTDTSASIPACTNFYLGTGEFDSGNQFNNRISAAAIYTSRLSNSELQSLTTL